MPNHFKKWAFGSTILFFGLTMSACAENTKSETSESGAEQITNATVVEVAEQSPKETDPTEAKSNDHDGHSHGTDISPEVQALLDNTDYVYTFAPDDHLFGSENAPVQMILYASIMCGHCANWFEKDWPLIKANYIDTGKVRMAFREIPTPPQELALTGFILANCAPQSQYLPMIEKQMAMQSDIFAELKNGSVDSKYREIAAFGGMETDVKIDACFANPDHMERIQRASLRMQAAGMRGVPAIIVNGEKLTNVQSSGKALTDILDTALEE